MKICYLCADLGIPVGGHKGAAAHVRGLVRALAALGHDIRVLTPQGGGPTEVGAPVVPITVPEISGAASRAEASSRSDAGSRSDDSRLARALGHLWNNVAVEGALRDLVPGFGADVIYERYSPFGIAGALLAERLGVPHVLEVNAPLSWEGKQYRRQALTEAADFIERTVFASTSLIVAVSAELRTALVDAGVPAEKVLVLPNGVDVELFASEGEARREGLEGKTVVGFVGSLKPWHGVDLLADAFRLLASDPALHLLVVGQGPLEKVVDSLSRELPGRVTRVGAVPHGEVPAHVRAFDIAVAPYPRLERFYYSPLKVLEYMAAGRAVVASSLGQLRELVQQGETGLLVEPGDPAALASAIRELAGDEDRRRTLGRAAALEARRSHSWSERAARLMDRMEELI